jgi:hypothetical protein
MTVLIESELAGTPRMHSYARADRSGRGYVDGQMVTSGPGQ